MKITVVSFNPERAANLAQLVRTSGTGLDVEFEVRVKAIDLKAQLSAIAQVNAPKLLVLDAADMEALDAVDQLTAVGIETLVISSDTSSAFLMRAMQVGVREVVTDDTTLQAAVQRLTRKRLSATKQGEVIAFTACKGGCGTSFLAANFAHVLSTRGDNKTVALIDLDLQYGDILMLLSDKRAASDIASAARSISRLDADLLRSIMVSVSGTLSVLAAPAELSHSLEVKATHVEAIIKQASQLFDYVVLDVGRSINSISLAAMDLASHVFPVIQLTLPQVRDAKRLQAQFRSLDYPAEKVHWLVNRYVKGDEITIDSFEQALGIKGISTVPNHYSSVSAAVNQGVPVSQLSRSNPVSRALNELAQATFPSEVVKKKEKWISGLFAS